MYVVNVKGVPTLASFDNAQNFFNKTHPWRDHARENERPLDVNGRRKRHMRIVKWDDRYECYLYRTPVVTYHRDGRITLEAHASRSTNAFVDKLLPTGIQVHYTDHVYWVCLRGSYPAPSYPYRFLGHDTRTPNPHFERDMEAYRAWENTTRVYKFRSQKLDITLRDGNWEIHDLEQTEPWRKYKVDMPKYNKILKELGYKDFHLWWKASRALHGISNKPTRWAPKCYADLFTLQGGPEVWADTKQYLNERAPAQIRQAIIRAHPVATVVDEKPYLTNMWSTWTYEKNSGRFKL